MNFENELAATYLVQRITRINELVPTCLVQRITRINELPLT